MKKISPQYSESLPPVKLFLDDVEKILETFRELGEEIIIQTAEYEIENLEELTKLHRDQITDIKILHRKPFVSLSLNNSGIHLYIEKDTPELRGVFAKIKDVLLCRKRYLAFNESDILLVTTPIIFLAGMNIYENDWSKKILGIGLLIVGVFIFIRSFVISTKKYALIILKYSNQEMPFWIRNMDNIFVAVISAFLGYLISLLTNILK